MEFSDQLGNKLFLSTFPSRIISLVPSITELLLDLGLGQEIVGVTRYCPLPGDVRCNPVIIGGTKDFNFEQIDAIAPDLIIGSREENCREGIISLQHKYPVWLCDVLSLNDALDMIKGIGDLVDRTSNAGRLVQEISKEFEKLPAYSPIRIAYVIWKDPFMVAAGQTFIDNILKFCGFINIFQEMSRYPEILLPDLSAVEGLLLSSEPYAFSDHDRDFLKNLFPHCKVALVDGTMFSWYGSHLRYAPAYFRHLRATLQ